MKKTGIICTLLLSFFICFSCGSDGEALPDIELNKVLEKSIPVSVITTNEMTVTVVLDATKDTEISKYENKIKNYEITSLEFAIENYSSPLSDEVYFNGTIGFSKQEAVFPSFECSVSSMPVTHWAGTGNFNIGNCDKLTEQLATILKGENAVKMYLTGTFTKEPLTFDLKVIADTKITANPG
jgi:hypothetical protein